MTTDLPAPPKNCSIQKQTGDSYDIICNSGLLKNVYHSGFESKITKIGAKNLSLNTSQESTEVNKFSNEMTNFRKSSKSSIYFHLIVTEKETGHILYNVTSKFKISFFCLEIDSLCNFYILQAFLCFYLRF